MMPGVTIAAVKLAGYRWTGACIVGDGQCLGKGTGTRMGAKIGYTGKKSLVTRWYFYVVQLGAPKYLHAPMMKGRPVMARFLLALDQGTTSSRAILFDEYGE